MRAKAPEERLGNSGNPPALKPKVIDVHWETPEAPETVEDLDQWERIWSLGGPSQVYHATADYNLVRRYCEMAERRDKLMAEIESTGWTDIGSKGQTIIHPLARVLSDLEAKMLPLEDRLGLNPQSRHTIQIGGAQAAEASSQMAKWLQDQQKD